MTSIIKICFLLFIIPFILQGKAGVELGNTTARQAFSGKVYIISIGIDDFGQGSILQHTQTDADAFIQAISKDNGFKKIEKFIFRNGSKKQDVYEKVELISRDAKHDDMFVLYYAGMGISDPGALLLGEQEKIDFNEIYDISQRIYCERQLYIVDASGGDVLINNYKNLIRTRSGDNISNDLNRIIVSLDQSYEGRANCIDTTFKGGYLTGALINNPVSISGLFAETTDRLYTRFKCGLYNCFWNDADFNFTFFSERLYINDFHKPQTRGVSLMQMQEGTSEEQIKIVKGETLCIIVGNTYFEQGWMNLPNTVNDSRAILNALKENYRVRCIYMENAKYKDFNDTLIAIKSKYTFEKGSQLLFYVASHGFYDPLNRGYLVFSDTKKDLYEINTGAFELQSLKRAMTSFGATNTLMLVDICHSGAAFSGSYDCATPTPPKIDKNSPIFRIPFEDGPASKNYLNQETNLYFGASSTEQEAADADHTGKNSPFTNVLLSFLNGNTLPTIDSYWLHEEIKDKIYNYGSFSDPVFCSFNCKPDGRFFFIRK